MRGKLFFILFAFLLLASLTSAATKAIATTITFNSLTERQVVKEQYAASGVHISAINEDNDPNLAVIFNTQTALPVEDTDLMGPPWCCGNLADPPETLGNLLIIEERSKDSDGDGFIDADWPDDEGKRPAGSIFFDFDMSIVSFGFDLVDVEDVEAGNGYFAAFYSNGSPLATVVFSQFTDSSSTFYVPGVVWGDNSANRIDPITVAELQTINPSITQFDRVEIRFGGSAGIDNIDYEVPEPATLLLLSTGVIGLAGFRRKSKKH